MQEFELVEVKHEKLVLDDALFRQIDALSEAVAEQVFWNHKYPDAQPRCPACGSVRYYYMKQRRRLDCVDCGKEYSSKVGTIFASSTLSFRQLLKAICLADEPKLTRRMVRDVVGVSESGASPLLARIRLIRATGSILTRPINPARNRKPGSAPPGSPLSGT